MAIAVHPFIPLYIYTVPVVLVLLFLLCLHLKPCFAALLKFFSKHSA